MHSFWIVDIELEMVFVIIWKMGNLYDIISGLKQGNKFDAVGIWGSNE